MYAILVSNSPIECTSILHIFLGDIVVMCGVDPVKPNVIAA